jgi:hypothetical protein
MYILYNEVTIVGLISAMKLEVLAKSSMLQCISIEVTANQFSIIVIDVN